MKCICVLFNTVKVNAALEIFITKCIMVIWHATIQSNCLEMRSIENRMEKIWYL